MEEEYEEGTGYLLANLVPKAITMEHRILPQVGLMGR
jgi:hypothetical protein